MEENEIVGEERPDDKCNTCGHRRDQHTSNQHCRQCQDCPKFEPKYDSPWSESVS